MVRTRVGRTPISCPKILTVNMTAAADAAQFIPGGQVVPRGAKHFRNDMCKGRGHLLLEVSFILWSFSVHKCFDVPPHEKVWRRQVRGIRGPWDGPITAEPVIVACVV
jgi:hypothetical protein